MKITTFVILLAVVLSACAPAATPEPIGKPITVEVGGRSMDIYCLGTGSPIVVLEGGLGAPYTYWSKVTRGMPAGMRVCTYDRSSSSHTSQEYVEDLHALLIGAKLEGPYVLVGHSFGGLNVILYAHQYPEDVAGILLVDITHPDAFAHFLAVLPAESPDDSQGLKDMREWFGTAQHDVNGVDIATSCDQVRGVKSLGDIPLIVLTAAAPNPGWENLPAEVSGKMNQVHQDDQKTLTRLSSDSTQIIASTTNHTIFEDEPGLVIEAIIKLVQAARSK